MTLEQLEALIRRELTAVAAAAFNPSQRYVTERMNDATRQILAAHDACALATYGVTADRRAELAAAVDDFEYSPMPVMHWQVHKPQSGPACGQQGVCTTTRADVSCARCKRTTTWKAAA